MQLLTLLLLFLSSASSLKYIVLLWGNGQTTLNAFSSMFSNLPILIPHINGSVLQYVDIGDLHVAIVDLELPSQARLLAASPPVKLVEAVVQVTANATVNAPGFLIQRPATWNLMRICRKLLATNNLAYFYNATACQGIDAYVMDTGVDVSHPEFQGRVRNGPNLTNESQNTDLNGHGTHVAGIIGSKGFGVCKNINIIPVKVMNSLGSGDSSAVILGLGWIQANRDKNRHSVVNISLSGAYSQIMNIAVNQLSQLGVVVVAAAGNSGANACNYSPASAASALTVGATTAVDEALVWPPSNFGPCVNINAPGSIIRSTYLRHGLAYMSGTSMAAPHVAGAVAMYWSMYPKLSADEVVRKVMWMATRGVLKKIGTSVNVLVFVEP